jgi:hypothetical protein
MKTVILLLAAISLFAIHPPAQAGVECPSRIVAAALAPHAGATVVSCNREREHGHTQYEVRLTTKDSARIEVDVSPEGRILLTEERIALGEVPPAVMRALTAKYAAARPSRAERQTAADGKVTYELGWESSGKRKEATFTADGAFVEEE